MGGKVLKLTKPNQSAHAWKCESSSLPFLFSAISFCLLLVSTLGGKKNSSLTTVRQHDGSLLRLVYWNIPSSWNSSPQVVGAQNIFVEWMNLWQDEKGRTCYDQNFLWANLVYYRDSDHGKFTWVNKICHPVNFWESSLVLGKVYLIYVWLPILF